jgi:acyl dehydratase
VERLHAEMRAHGDAFSDRGAGNGLRIMSKSGGGNFFEDFKLGQVIRHATPRTVTAGDVALYLGLFGGRFAVQSSDAFAQAIGYPHAPIDDLLVFHIVFGKTVPDISLNAIANLGYAACRFRAAVYPGDTLSAVSEVIGLRETSNKQSGVVLCARRLQGRRHRSGRLRALGDGAQARREGAGARSTRAAIALARAGGSARRRGAGDRHGRL